MDLREPAVAAFRAGSSCRAVGERFGVAESSVVKWGQREATTGSVAPGKVGGHRKPVLAPHHDRLMERVAQTPDVTLTALRCNLAAQGVNVSLDTIWRYLRAAGLSFKKSALAEEQNRPDVARKRLRWQPYQGMVDPRRLFFIDVEAGSGIDPGDRYPR